MIRGENRPHDEGDERRGRRQRSRDEVKKKRKIKKMRGDSIGKAEKNKCEKTERGGGGRM